MNKLIVAMLAMAVSAVASSAEPAAAPAATQPTQEQVVQQFREDLLAKRADVMAKGLSLTADQAAKFWPVFNAYQKEQNGIIEDQLRDIKKYVEGYDSLSDAGALALMQAHFARDTKMNALRQKWLGEFQKVLPTKLAVRAMQIDRRLSLAAQTEVTSRIPLVH